METPQITPQESQPKIILSKQLIPLDEWDSSTMDTLNPPPTEQIRLMREGAKKVGDLRKRFWNMLIATVEQTGYRPPQGRPTKILDIGCGDCIEGSVLTAYFGGSTFGTNSENAKLTGIDLKGKEIEKAKQNYTSADFSKKITTYKLLPNFHFIAGDATHLESYPEIPKEADVVMIRHQEISANNQIWENIIRAAAKRLSPNGIMILTSFSELEHQMLVEKINELGLKIVLNKKNPYAKKTAHPDVKIDNHVVIIKTKNN